MQEFKVGGFKKGGSRVLKAVEFSKNGGGLNHRQPGRTITVRRKYYFKLVLNFIVRLKTGSFLCADFLGIHLSGRLLRTAGSRPARFEKVFQSEAPCQAKTAKSAVLAWHGACRLRRPRGARTCRPQKTSRRPQSLVPPFLKNSTFKKVLFAANSKKALFLVLFHLAAIFQRVFAR